MKKYTVIIIISILIIGAVAVFAILLGGKPEYTDSVASVDLAMIAKESFTTEGGVKMLDDDVILKFTDEDLPYLKDYCVIKAKASKNINEFGIFRVEDGKAQELEDIITLYLQNQQETYRAMNYFPEEVEKIDSAVVKVFGNYVVYSFLNEEDTSVFYSAIEEQIKK